MRHIIKLAFIFMLLATALHGGESIWGENFDSTEAQKKYHAVNGMTFETGAGVGGSTCLKFSYDKPEGGLLSIPLDVEKYKGKRIVLKAMMKAENLQKAAKSYLGPKLTLFRQTESGDKQWIDQKKEYGSYDWKEFLSVMQVPKDAVKMTANIGIQSGVGTLYIDDLVVFECVSANYEKYTVTGDSDKIDYQPGETMTFSFQILNDGKPVDGKVRIKLSADDGNRKTWDAKVAKDEPLTFTASLNQPGFVMAKAMLLDEVNVPVKRASSKGSMRNIQYGVAGGVLPQNLKQGVPEPQDYDDFWKKQKEKLAAVPMKVIEKKLFKTSSKSNIYDMKIACASKRPVSGYLAIPKDAKPKSLPINMYYDGYSVRSSHPRDTGKAIDFSVNAHGIENNKDASYYADLRKGDLKSYGFNDKENEKGETCYFNGTILRDLRALEYAKSLPEWDGKTITISGGSQGGLQTIAIASLDHDTTSCSVGVPWFCDLGGITIKRTRGWRPNFKPGLGYYDTVNFAKRVKCPVKITAGLSDWVCPPSGVWVLYNNLTCPATLTMKQGMDHARYFGYNDKTVKTKTYKK